MIFHLCTPQPGERIPRNAGIWVAVGTVKGMEGEPFLILADHTTCLSKALRQLPLTHASWMTWQVAYLEVSEADRRERYAADLQFGFALRRAA